MRVDGRYVVGFFFMLLLSVSLVSAVWWNPATWFTSPQPALQLSPVCEQVERDCDEFTGDVSSCRGHVDQGCEFFDEDSSCSGVYGVEECTESVASPELLNLDFGAGDGQYRGSGVIGTGGDYWNGGEEGALYWADGRLSPVRLTTRGLGGRWGAPFSIDERYGRAMMNSYAYSSGTSASVVLSDVPAGTYDVYVYGQGDQFSQTGDYTLQGVHKVTSATSSSCDTYSCTHWQEGLQYVVFRDVSVTQGSLSLAIAPTSYGAMINGMQIIQTSASSGGGRTALNTQSTSVDTCTDSDNGINFTIRGQIEVRNSSGALVGSDWDDCDEEFFCHANGTAGVVSPACPNGCSDGVCLSALTCTSFTYSTWSACDAQGQQNRTILSSAPANCTGGAPLLTQSCTSMPVPTTSYLTENGYYSFSVQPTATLNELFSGLPSGSKVYLYRPVAVSGSCERNETAIDLRQQRDGCAGASQAFCTLYQGDGMHLGCQWTANDPDYGTRCEPDGVIDCSNYINQSACGLRSLCEWHTSYDLYTSAFTVSTTRANGSFISTDPSLTVADGGFILQLGNISARVALNGLSYTEARPITLYPGTFNLFGIPFCADGFNYTAGRVIRELKEHNISCSLLYEPTLSGTSGIQTWYTTNLSHYENGTEQDFVLNASRAYWIGQCAIARPTIWTPSCIEGSVQIPSCTGCYYRDRCFPFGSRLTITNEQSSYCSVDAIFKTQKIGTEQNPAPCENNYECDSNSCSSGRCVDVQGTLQKNTLFRRATIDLLCRLTNLLNDSGYQSCKMRYLGV